MFDVSTRRQTIKGLLASGVAVCCRGMAQNLSPEAEAAALKMPLNVSEFEALARSSLPPAHFGYLATGADDDATVVVNHAAFSSLEIRSRRLINLRSANTGTNVFGATWRAPIYLSAIASMRAFQAEGEAAVARGARAQDAQMMLSTGASVAVEKVAEARGAPVWQQLYPTDDWHVTQAVVTRAEKAGCPAIVLTVDSLPGRNNETEIRAARIDTRQCDQCHINNSHDLVRKSPIFSGIDVSGVSALVPIEWDWDFIARLRKVVRGKMLVKGIVTYEDALLAVKHGVDGVIVSNHGGNSEETLRSTIECLPEVVSAAGRHIPVFLDGGIRRGTDVFKALALGATAVGIGRPYAWGLAAFGSAGVARILEILQKELLKIMMQAGTPTVAAIGRTSVIHR